MRNGLITYASGSKFWYKDDLLHREGGPAIETPIGSKHWFINGLRHREDGPAIEWHDEYKQWWLNGKHIIFENNEEFLRMVKMKAFW